MTRNVFPHPGTNGPPTVGSYHPGPTPSMPEALRSSGASPSSVLDRVTGFFRRQAEKQIQHRMSEWFHRQTDRLFSSPHHWWYHPLSQSGSIETIGPIDNTTEEERMSGEGSSETNSVGGSRGGGGPVRNNHRSRPHTTTRRVPSFHRRPLHPRTTPRNNNNFSFDQQQQPSPIPPYQYGWSPYWQTPPFTPPSQSSSRIPLLHGSFNNESFRDPFSGRSMTDVGGGDGGDDTMTMLSGVA